MEKYLKDRHRFSILAAVLLILLVILFTVSLNTGAMKIPLSQMLSAFFGSDTGNQRITLFEFRLPRIVLSILIGAGMSVSGAILQSVSKNPLADPGIIGINAGAGFAVVLYIFFFNGTSFLAGTLSIFVMPFTALAGACLAAILIYGIARTNGSITPARLILTGIGLNAAFSAGTTVLQMKMDPQDFTKTLTWISGSIWATNWDYVRITFIWLIVLIPLAIYKVRYMNLMHLDESIVVGLGVSLEKERMKLLIMAVGLAGSCVAVGGGVTFLGLIAPHIARRLTGPNYEYVLPLAALLGACILLLSDTVARVIIAPMELPVGIVLSILGAPYFIYLLMRMK
ncbi:MULTISPECIES: FecCD family ABC transporter permease [unclassified Sporolactobacillus]|uniref:FecCD family ABC transporter permease n=1 Tax=unclassified Sporolactobacillus TaxID=2628533 RepID=UPI00236838E6|nr:iron ABC transporter permease [Sporolactobacillus sp. CQH2019]MDD9150155.1 iron ABC transporter permease [Sporolactobacillus sp. CQH2019]